MVWKKRSIMIAILIFAFALGLYQDHQKASMPGQWTVVEGGKAYKDGRGKLVTGWQEIDGVRYYFGNDGILASGWQEDEGGTFYLDPDGTLAIGWRMIDGKRCYLDETGNLVTGWTQVHGESCYFLADGTPGNGWTEIEGKTYLLNNNGVPATGWQTVEERTYFFSENGAMVTGWMEHAGNDYYFQDNGVMAVGEILIDGEKFHFSPTGIHVILVNPWNALPEGYDPELYQINEYYRIRIDCYDSLMAMMEDCRAAGHYPVLSSAYRTMGDQEFLYQRKVNYYLDLGYDTDKAQELAATVIAFPGTSEHQLGLAVDIVDGYFTNMTDEQANTATQKWLMEHCWEYGFILRYPKGTTDITGIIYEPWHYRYVGVELAEQIHHSGLTLEEFLGATQS